RESLNFLFLCVVTAVKRQAGNPIRLYLEALQVNDDMDALKEFLRRCSRPDIAPHIKSLQIEYQDLPYIPEEISGLTALNRLCIDGNKVGTFDRIMPITSLQQLTFLAINGMDLEKLDPKILNLSKLERLCMSFNRLKRDDLELVIQLPNLERAYCNGNLIKQEDVDYLKRKYPSLEKLLSFSIL
nr:hypothetical protein [Candidatus Dependentiae bacterium]